MNTPYCVITDAGREIMRGVNVSGTTAKSDSFTFTNISIGCGTYTEGQKTESALRVRTALVESKNSYPVSSLKKISNADNLYKVSGVATNYDALIQTPIVDEGYYITEIGLFGKAEGGTKKLLAIAVIDEPDYMPGINTSEEIEGQIYQIVYDLYFGYSNVELDATIESGGAYYLAEDGEELERLIGAGEGVNCVRIGNSTASDYDTIAIGSGASASNYNSIAIGKNASASLGGTAIGTGTQAEDNGQSARGKYNKADYGGLYADIVGNGTSDSNRSNAYALTWGGDAEYQLESSEALYTALANVQKQSEVVNGGMMSLKSMLGLLLQGLTAQTANGTKNNSVTAAGTCGLIKIGNIVICNFRLAYTSGTDTIPQSTTLYTVPEGFRPLSSASCNVTVIRGTSLQPFGGYVTVGTDGTIKHAHGESVTSLNGTLVWISNM